MSHAINSSLPTDLSLCLSPVQTCPMYEIYPLGMLQWLPTSFRLKVKIISHQCTPFKPCPYVSPLFPYCDSPPLLSVITLTHYSWNKPGTGIHCPSVIPRRCCLTDFRTLLTAYIWQRAILYDPSLNENPIPHLHRPDLLPHALLICSFWVRLASNILYVLTAYLAYCLFPPIGI